MAVIINFPINRVTHPQAIATSVGGPVCIGNTVLRFPGVEPAPVSAPVQGKPGRPGLGRRGKAKEEDHRKDMLAKVHMALQGNKKRGVKGLFETLPGFAEDAYRFALRERWGVNSAADMTHYQLHALLLYLKSLGFTGFKSRRNRKMLSHEDRIETIKALLQERADRHGTDVSWAYAVGILKRETKGAVTSFDKAAPKELDAVIAALRRNAKYAKGHRNKGAR